MGCIYISIRRGMLKTPSLGIFDTLSAGLISAGPVRSLWLEGYVCSGYLLVCF